MRIFNTIARLSLLSFFSVFLVSTKAQTKEAQTNTPEKKIDSNYKLSEVTVLKVDATINPAVHHYLENHYKKAKPNQAILIELNTPGGLVSTTKDILQLIGDADIPTFVWVGPEGASATSAGAIIASGSHLLMMANGTNIGASTPVTLGKDLPSTPEQNPNEDPRKKIEEELKKQTSQKNSSKNNLEEKAANKKVSGDLRAKAINDLRALVSSLSTARNRNSEAFARMVDEAKSYTAQEALEKNIIDEIVHSREHVKKWIHGQKITIKGTTYTIQNADDFKFVVKEMSAGDQLLNVFAHPQTAYFLVLLGLGLLYFELQAPGGFIAGAIGAVCLMLAAVGMQVLPVNMGGVGLILLSFVLFMVDLYVTSFGILSLMGLASFFFGSLLLYDTSDSLITVNQQAIYSATIGIAVVLGGIGYLLAKDLRKKDVDTFGPEGKIGTVFKKLEGGQVQIKVDGQFWNAEFENSANASPEGGVDIGQSIEVLAKESDRMVLRIRKKNPT